VARTPIIYGTEPEPDTAVDGRPVPPWFRGPDPDPARVRQLYIEQGLQERDAAKQLGISRARLIAALEAAGIPRRERPCVACPLNVDELREVLDQGGSVARLADEHQVSHSTARRWLAAAGLLPPDPALPVELLRQLYVVQRMSTRAIAEQTGISRSRVIHALTGAGIPARGYTARHNGRRRDNVTDEVLAELYVEQGLTLDTIAARFGVTAQYLSSRCRELSLIPRPGAFGPRTGYSTEDLAAEATRFYTDGLNVHQVADRLGVSSSTVWAALHKAQVPLRGTGWRGREQQPRTLIEDLYGDPLISDCLRHHQVHQPPLEQWRPARRWESYAPLPLAGLLLRELYVDIGLSIAHIAMLCGVGTTQVRNRLGQLGVTMRGSRTLCPWNERRRHPN
jgi:predicted DNA-binding protein (UPF0251 family)/DNA-binding phage protein